MLANSSSSSQSCLIIGGGITGLMAGTVLQQQGITVTIVDKGRGIGGRLATRRIQHPDPQQEKAVFDYGMQRFAVSDRHFRVWVEDWLAQGVVVQWGKDESGQPTYRGTQSNRAIAQHLGQNLQVHTQQRVTAITWQDDHWVANTAAGQTFAAQKLLITAPVPQTLQLLKESAIALPSEVHQRLQQIHYEPCIAVLALLAAPSNLPREGLALQDESLAWLASNHLTGISRLPAVTLHATPEFSRTHWDADNDITAATLLQIASPWLGSQVLEYQVHRWRYSQPQTFYGERCLALSEPGCLVMAGDAFAPRDSVNPKLNVERAALSGLAAAAILSHREP